MSQVLHYPYLSGFCDLSIHTHGANILMELYINESGTSEEKRGESVI